MNRSARIALTAVATSAVVAGAAGAVLFGPLDAHGAATAQGPGTAPIAAEPGHATSLDEALARLTQETTGLQAELAAAGRRLEAAGSAPPGSAVSPGARPVAPTARQAARPAPPVHTRTGASSATGHHETEAEDD